MHGIAKQAIVIDATAGIENSARVYTRAGIDHRTGKNNRPLANSGVATDGGGRMNQCHQASPRRLQLKQLGMTDTVITDSNQHPIEIG